MYYIAMPGETGSLPEAYQSLLLPHFADLIARDRVPEFEVYESNVIFSACFGCGERHGDRADRGERATVLADETRLLFLCKTPDMADSIKEMLESSGNHGDTGKVLQQLFAELLHRQFEDLEDLEDLVADAEESLMLSGDDEAPARIMEFRKEIRRVKKIGEPLSRVIQGFLENDSGILGEEGLRHYKILYDRADRLLLEIQTLHEYVSQIREAYQAQTDIRQNDLTKLFTVVAAIFLPLTLVVGWYGMNFDMPEYHWKYGYIFVAALSLFTLAGIILYFKKKKWL